jgi:iron complex transport system substrate-binding protein
MPVLRLGPSRLARLVRRLGPLLLSPLALACAGGDAGRARGAAAAGAAPIVDDFGDTVRVAARPARIVSINPATTELLFALGAGPRLVGRSRWDEAPDSARFVPDVGDGISPNVEAVLARRPDLVVLYAAANNRAAAERLRAAGVPTISLKIDRVEHFRRAAALLGRVTGDSARARTVVDTVDASLERARRVTAPRPKPSVFWHVWDSPLITIGGGSYMTELVEAAGGRNVYGDLPDVSPQVSMEDLLRRDPDVILAGPEGAKRIAADPSWRQLRAARTGRVLVVDPAVVGRQGPRMGEAALALARLLHPGAFGGDSASGTASPRPR